MGAIMFPIQPHGYTRGGNISNPVLSDFSGLVQVGNELYLYASLMSSYQGLRNTGMGERECLHQHLLSRAIDGLDNVACGIIAWRKKHLNISSGIGAGLGRLESIRRRYCKQASKTRQQYPACHCLPENSGGEHVARILTRQTFAPADKAPACLRAKPS